MTTDNLLTWQATGEANCYLITKPCRFGRDWVASVRLNGEMNVLAQDALMSVLVAALNTTEE